MAVTPGPRVLSVKQPWAWAIVSGLKYVENRSWKTPSRHNLYPCEPSAGSLGHGMIRNAQD
jgi:hypothetical protein